MQTHSGDRVITNTAWLNNSGQVVEDTWRGDSAPYPTKIREYEKNQKHTFMKSSAKLRNPQETC